MVPIHTHVPDSKRHWCTEYITWNVIKRSKRSLVIYLLELRKIRKNLSSSLQMTWALVKHSPWWKFFCREEMEDVVGSVFDLMGRTSDPILEEEVINQRVDHMFEVYYIIMLMVTLWSYFADACYFPEDGSQWWRSRFSRGILGNLPGRWKYHQIHCCF